MTLSVIIPSKNAENLRACLDAIDKNEYCRVIVVDDGVDWSKMRLPKSGCLECCRRPVIRIKGAEPFVFSRNVNIGIVAAGNDDVVIMNDDALLQSHRGFTLLKKESERHPEYGIIGATTNVTGQILQRRQRVGLRDVPHFAFVCVFIPRRTINNPRIGYLDERFKIDYGCEDLDYCTSVKNAGLRVGVHDGCFVDHSQLTSTFRGDPNTPRSFAKNLELYRAKWGSYALR